MPFVRFTPCVCLQVAFRMFALDVVMVLLAQDEREAPEALEPDLAGYLSHHFLVRSVVYDRCSDVSSTVRAHAMHCLAQCLELPSHSATKWIHDLFSSSSTSILFHFIIHFIPVTTTMTKSDACALFCTKKVGIIVL